MTDIKKHIVLARKYRPMKLSEVIGQDTLVRILTNAINSNRVHHAFMLTGTRGVGKTTTARILALSLNCTGIEGHSKETVNPCMKCNSCISIVNGSNPDVFEFDAASNTGVDAMRDIIDKCNFQPMISRYKIYIIDEVHMLSKSAFNALLKTLEEPPENIKFIFATTEIRKVPITIISRCQKFFLKDVPQDLLAIHLKNIAEKENVKIDDKVFNIIAKHANGSVRDSLSILDQIINSNNNEEITFDLAKKVLSIPDLTFMSELFYNLYLNNVEESIKITNNLLSLDSDPQIIMSDLMSILCDAIKFINKININDINEENLLYFNKLNNASLLNIPRIIRIWEMLITSLNEIKIVNKKLYFEMLIYKICFVSSLPTTIEIVKLIENENLRYAISQFPKGEIVE